MNLFDELKDVKKAIAQFDQVKELFEEAAKLPVKDLDGKDRQAFQVASKLFKQAIDHRIVIGLHIGELTDGNHDEADRLALLKDIKDQHTELGKFVAEAQAVAGAEFQLFEQVLAARK